MIESHYWKTELRRDIAWLRKYRRYNRWSERQQVLYERRLILAAFQSRTLLERPKIRASVATRETDVIEYKKTGASLPTLYDRHELWFHFDLDNPRNIQLLPVQICNQLIHHYLMVTTSESRHFKTVLVYSDYKRGSCMYEMDIVSLIDLFATFSRDDSAISNARVVWNGKRLDYDVLDTE
jgi:hypothetical protein